MFAPSQLPRSSASPPPARRKARKLSPEQALNLLRALSTVSGMTLLSRVTGLARESLKAAAFGAGMQMDAFEAAFRLPNILRRLFAEGAFSQAFVPFSRSTAGTAAMTRRARSSAASARCSLSCSSR
jgi:peptidoglycan biosynthesis protein MviN/MurJ (putative lipid II flippase)